jgi:hypothetical protein
MTSNKVLRNAALLGTVVMGLTIALPMAAQARTSGWYARPQSGAVCIRHNDFPYRGRPYKCEFTGTTSNHGVNIRLPGDRGTVRF